MRFFSVLILFTLLLISPFLTAQSNDTDFKVEDQSRDAVRELVKKEFSRWQDSVKAERIKKEVAKHGKPLDVFLQEMREREKAQKRQLYFRIGLGVAFLIVLAISLFRKGKKT
jgi:hypothetical protein